MVETQNFRFIPAGAGNTGKTNIGVRVVPVYPRWRGEHSIRRFCSSSDAGLSPLARGTHKNKTPKRLYLRFIPAGAGNTMKSHSLLSKSAVYPRWRGEHVLPSYPAGAAAGLSPLARGTPPVAQQQRGNQRFIPAGAGNTHGGHSPPKKIPVYPRWRGEHFSPAFTDGAFAGLSPLARGTQ